MTPEDFTKEIKILCEKHVENGGKILYKSWGLILIEESCIYNSPKYFGGYACPLTILLGNYYQRLYRAPRSDDETFQVLADTFHISKEDLASFVAGFDNAWQNTALSTKWFQVGKNIREWVEKKFPLGALKSRRELLT